MRARQWSRAAIVLAALFGSLGVWGFDGAWGMACLSAILAIYFHVVGWRHARIADPAGMLERAQELAASGRVEAAIAVLTETIRVSPWFWQARQYRGALYSIQGKADEAARDFAEMVRLGGDAPRGL